MARRKTAPQRQVAVPYKPMCMDRFHGHGAASRRRAPTVCTLEEDRQRLCEKAGRSSARSATRNDVQAHARGDEAQRQFHRNDTLHCLKMSWCCARASLSTNAANVSNAFIAHDRKKYFSSSDMVRSSTQPVFANQKKSHTLSIVNFGATKDIETMNASINPLDHPMPKPRVPTSASSPAAPRSPRIAMSEKILIGRKR